MIEQRLGGVLAVRPALELVANARCCPLKQTMHRGAQRTGAIFVAQSAQALATEPRAANLAAEVADDDVRDTAVVAKDGLDFAVHAILGELSHGPNQKTVVKHLAGGGARRSWHQATDVSLVSDAGAESDDLSFVEDRGDHDDVRYVRVASLVRIVGDEAVPVAHLGNRVALAHAFYLAGVEERMILQPSAHHDDAALRIAQARCAILRLAEDRRIAAVEKRVRHRGRSFADAADDHRGSDGIERHRTSSVIRRLPKSSTVTVCPANTTVVESYCSTMAGPEMRAWALSRARSYTAASEKARRVRS